MLITSVDARDIRFPTSRTLDGSDAMNPDPDYSAAYVVLRTDGEHEGHGLTFTIGRGNELCVQAIRALSHLVVGASLADFTENPGAFWRRLSSDSQLRWLGPEKGVIHMAMGALVNALWDLAAKSVGKPLWRWLAEMSPAELVRCIDFRYITDVLTPAEATEILEALKSSRQERIDDLLLHGYPAYTTSAGWLGYSDDKMRRLCREAREKGFRHLKIKVGLDLDDDIRRSALIREELGPDVVLMMDANQRWDVDEAIRNMESLARFEPLWIEEPTSPDDVLGHAKIAEAVRPILVATGEHCHNRVMFKQFLQAGALGICQIDSCRVGGVNENLAILLMAAKFGIPVCPHAGGVGLCEHVQHLSMLDYVSISGTQEGRIIEYVDHLHEHFVDPVVIREGAYMPPERPGYSIEMKAESLAEYEFPQGKAWRRRAAHFGF